jgi:predicted lactoylglutathione lyase
MIPYTFGVITSIFINMPFSSVERSTEFFRSLGFSVNEQFTSADSACIIISPTIMAMLSNSEKFQLFIDKKMTDKSASEVILSLACESEAEVRRIAEKAFELGARKVNESEDNEFMFSWAFEDLDGHLWDLFWMKSA